MLIVIAMSLCIFSSVRMYNKIVVLEKINHEYGDQLENYISFFISFEEMVLNGIVRLQKIDKKGAFSSDDEIGFAFKTIQSVFDNLGNIFTHYKYEEENREK